MSTTKRQSPALFPSSSIWATPSLTTTRAQNSPGHLDNMDGSYWSVFQQDASSSRIYTADADPITLGAFLIVYPLAGFFTLIWAFWSEPTGRSTLKRSIGMSFLRQLGTTVGIYNIHRSLIALVIMDSFYGVMSIVLGSFLVMYCPSSTSCSISATVWFLFRAFVIIDHFIAALMCVMHMSNPTQGTTSRWLIIFSSLFIAVLSPLYVFYANVAVILLGVVVLILALTLLIKSRLSVVAPFTSQQKKLLVLVPMINLLAVYAPGFIVECMILSGVLVTSELYLCVLFYTSFNIVLDGVLSFLILKLASAVEQHTEQQQPTPYVPQQPAPYGQQPAPYAPQQPAPYAPQQPTPYGQQPPAYGQQLPTYGQQPMAQWQSAPANRQQPDKGVGNSGFTFSG